MPRGRETRADKGAGWVRKRAGPLAAVVGSGSQVARERWIRYEICRYGLLEELEKAFYAELLRTFLLLTVSHDQVASSLYVHHTVSRSDLGRTVAGCRSPRSTPEVNTKCLTWREVPIKPNHQNASVVIGTGFCRGTRDELPPLCRTNLSRSLIAVGDGYPPGPWATGGFTKAGGGKPM